MKKNQIKYILINKDSLKDSIYSESSRQYIINSLFNKTTQ